MLAPFWIITRVGLVLNWAAGMGSFGVSVFQVLVDWICGAHEEYKYTKWESAKKSSNFVGSV